METIHSDEAAELAEDGFKEVATAIVNDYDSRAMPLPEAEEFGPEFKKWVKVMMVLSHPTVKHSDRGTIKNDPPLGL